MHRALGCLLLAFASLVRAQTTQPFPIGIYGVPASDADMAAVQEMGFSHVHIYTLTGTTPEQLKAARDFLDLANKHGLKVMFDFNGKKLTADPDGLSDLRTIVANVKSHPALAMWYLYDEPVPKAPVETLKRFYDYLKHTTPDVPVATCLNHAEGWHDYAAATDIMLNDFYPVRGSAFPNSNLKITTTFTHEALHTGRKVMPVLQCFNWACFAPKNATTYRGFPVAALRYPNETELRYMIYANLAQGIDGLFFYSYVRGQRYDPKWFAETFAPVIRDLRVFTGIVAPASSPKVFKVAQDFDLYMALWSRPTAKYLLIANGQPEPRTVEESIDSTIENAELIPIARTHPSNATLHSGRLKVHLDPWEVLIWELKIKG